MKRRSFCKNAIAGVAGAVLGAASAGTAAAHGHGEVSTRGHFDVGWWNFVYLDDDHTETDYEINDPVPGFRESGSPEEILVFSHGWLIDEGEADETFEIVDGTLDAIGYDHPFVGFDWDADEVAWYDDWYPSERIARRNGAKLGAFLRDYRDGNPGTRIRLGGHSLGAQVVLSTVEHLDEWDRTDVLDSVFLIGAAAEEDAPITYGEFGDEIERAVGEFDNFHSVNDDDLVQGFTSVEWELPLGGFGADGPTPDNYEDHDVSDVTDHLHYYREDVGCMRRVVDEF